MEVSFTRASLSVEICGFVNKMAENSLDLVIGTELPIVSREIVLESSWNLRCEVKFPSH